MPSNYYLSQVIWYNPTIGVPLDTVSIVLSRYNNSVSTSKTTVYGVSQRSQGLLYPKQ